MYAFDSRGWHDHFFTINNKLGDFGETSSNSVVILHIRLPWGYIVHECTRYLLHPLISVPNEFNTSGLPQCIDQTRFATGLVHNNDTWRKYSQHFL